MSFAWPIALVGLAFVPVLLGIYMWAQRRRRRDAVRFTNLALLREVVGRGPGLRRHVPPALFLLGMAALLVSLARPSMVMAVPRDETAVMLVLDVSGSMAARDVQPTRLGAATQAAKNLISALPRGAQVGVVSFSDRANVAAPLANDPTAASHALDRLKAGGGTAVGDGLNLALDQLAARPPTDAQGDRAPAVIVLLSDGETTMGAPPATAAARAQQQGVTVDTIGIGQRGVAAPLNRQTRVGLDETALKTIASATGGQYLYAADAGQLSDVYAHLGSQIAWVQEQTEVTAIASGLGAALLMTAGMLAMAWFGRLP